MKLVFESMTVTKNRLVQLLFLPVASLGINCFFCASDECASFLKYFTVFECENAVFKLKLEEMNGTNLLTTALLRTVNYVFSVFLKFPFFFFFGEVSCRSFITFF